MLTFWHGTTYHTKPSAALYMNCLHDCGREKCYCAYETEAGDAASRHTAEQPQYSNRFRCHLKEAKRPDLRSWLTDPHIDIYTHRCAWHKGSRSNQSKPSVQPGRNHDNACRVPLWRDCYLTETVTDLLSLTFTTASMWVNWWEVLSWSKYGLSCNCIPTPLLLSWPVKQRPAKLWLQRGESPRCNVYCNASWTSFTFDSVQQILMFNLSTYNRGIWQGRRPTRTRAFARIIWCKIPFERKSLWITVGLAIAKTLNLNNEDVPCNPDYLLHRYCKRAKLQWSALYFRCRHRGQKPRGPQHCDW